MVTKCGQQSNYFSFFIPLFSVSKVSKKRAEAVGMEGKVGS